jgi:hypothetical protein
LLEASFQFFVPDMAVISEGMNPDDPSGGGLSNATLLIDPLLISTTLFAIGDSISESGLDGRDPSVPSNRSNTELSHGELGRLLALVKIVWFDCVDHRFDDATVALRDLDIGTEADVCPRMAAVMPAVGDLMPEIEDLGVCDIDDFLPRLRDVERDCLGLVSGGGA